MSELARKLRLPVGGRVAVVNPPDGCLAALGQPATGAVSMRGPSLLTACRSALSATSDRSGRKLSIRGSHAATRLIANEQSLALALRFGVTT
jgi:hypothetical protein